MCFWHERQRIPKFTKGYRLTDLLEMSNNKKGCFASINCLPKHWDHDGFCLKGKDALQPVVLVHLVTASKLRKYLVLDLWPVCVTNFDNLWGLSVSHTLSPSYLSQLGCKDWCGIWSYEGLCWTRKDLILGKAFIVTWISSKDPAGQWQCKRYTMLLVFSSSHNFRLQLM